MSVYSASLITKRDTRVACARTARTGGSLSAGIRQHPLKTGAVVTQFVTQAWRRSCAAAIRVTAPQVFDADCWCE
jgi:hypothetical protein